MLVDFALLIEGRLFSIGWRNPLRISVSFKKHIVLQKWKIFGKNNAKVTCSFRIELVIARVFLVIFQKPVRVFHRDFKHEKTDESTRPHFYCFRVFETPMKHEALVFEITPPTKEN